MPTQTFYNVFISSPSDVDTERDFADNVIKMVARNCAEPLGITLSIKRWEDMPAQTTEMPQQQIQDLINKVVEKCHFFVLILHKRYGAFSKGKSKKSNTELEINTILKLRKGNPKLKILAYFKDIPPNEDPGEQERQVKKLRERLQRNNILSKPFKSPEEFQTVFIHDLYETVLRMKFSTIKREYLSKFWELGTKEGETPRLAVIYPPVERGSTGNKDGSFWMNRLLPTIYFEESKALHKIKKNMDILGIPSCDWQVYTDAEVPESLLRINRVWLCLPRNSKATQQLKHYQKTCRFKFAPRTEGKLSYSIIWKDKNSQPITIKSPLSDYLEVQRKTFCNPSWSAQHAKVIAKDYAILARFSETSSSDVHVPLKDFFFSGIRGLGTWGAAWFLDRNYEQLKNYNGNKDIQILLEVTFEEGRIKEVKNVSDESKDYFHKANSASEIKRVISQFQGQLGKAPRKQKKS